MQENSSVSAQCIGVCACVSAQLKLVWDALECSSPSESELKIAAVQLLMKDNHKVFGIKKTDFGFGQCVRSCAALIVLKKKEKRKVFLHDLASCVRRSVNKT